MLHKIKTVSAPTCSRAMTSIDSCDFVIPYNIKIYLSLISNNNDTESDIMLHLYQLRFCVNYKKYIINVHNSLNEKFKLQWKLSKLKLVRKEIIMKIQKHYIRPSLKFVLTIIICREYSGQTTLFICFAKFARIEIRQIIRINSSLQLLMNNSQSIK